MCVCVSVCVSVIDVIHPVLLSLSAYKPTSAIRAMIYGDQYITRRKVTEES